MNLDLKSLINSIGKEQNINELKKKIETFHNNTAICDSYISEGSFGKVFINRLPNKVILNGETFDFPAVKLEKSGGYDEKTKKEDSEHQVRFMVKSGRLKVLTNNSMFGEALVSSLVTGLYLDRITPHVSVFLGHSLCDGHNRILYENLTYGPNSNYGDFQHFINYMRDRGEKVSDIVVDTVIIQVLHTFSLLNEQYNLIHFDFEDRNLFIKVIEKDESYYGVDNFLSYDYLVYNVGSKKLYLKNPGFLIKIGDFGGACMSSGKLTVENNFSSDNNSIKLSKFYPNYPVGIKKFLPDVYPFLRYLILKFGITNRVLYRLATEIPVLSTMIINEESKSSILPNYEITKKELESTISIPEILSSGIFESYHKVPEDMKKPLEIGKG